MIEEAKGTWVDIALQKGKGVPEPNTEPEERYSGKFPVHIPKTLHKDLAVRARKEDVSLNQLIIYLLSSGIGMDGNVADQKNT